MKQFIILNFINLLKSFTTIPVNVLIEPLARQKIVLKNTTTSSDIMELELLGIIAGHSRLDPKTGLKLCDLMSKMFLDNWQNAHIISNILIGI